MFLSDLSIKRPVFATVLMLALVTLGVFSYRRLAIDMMPDVEIPFLSIVTQYPGASPETVEREVSKRIEQAVNPISGVKHVFSTSREGLSVVYVEFNLEVKINDVAQDARSKISAIRNDLPAGIEEPVIQKLDIGGMAVLSVAVRSERMTPRELTTLVDRKVKRRLENLPGVGKVDLVGESLREVAVDLDPARLDALGLGVDEVVAGLAGENVNTPLGRLSRGDQEMPVRVSGKPKEVDGFRSMVVATRGGVPIALGEVAEVRDTVEEQRKLALVSGVPAVALDVYKQSKANTVGVVEAVTKELEELRAELPPSVDIQVVRDGSIMIKESVHDVTNTLIIGAILTILIVFLFLNSWRSTVITGLTLPISVISSFIVMYFLGMTLNIMTLMALSLAIGLLIDDAIVVRENIVRHLEQGQDHMTAARVGTAEIGLAVLATTLSIVAVFVPVAFMKGIMGRFFFQFGITVAFAVLVSLFVSFTLDPMLSSRWVDPDVERIGNRHAVARALDRFNDWFDRTADGYKVLIAWALDHRKAVLALATAAFVLGVGLFGALKSEFLGVYDQAEFQIKFRTAPGASFDETKGRMDAVLAELGKMPEVKHTYASIGAGDMGTVRDARVYVKLVEKSERGKHATVLAAEARQRISGIAGIIPSVEMQSDDFAEKPVMVSIRGEEIPLLKKYAAELKKGALAIRGIEDVEVTLELDLPEYRLVVDRERAAASGLSTPAIARTVGALVGGQAVTTYEDEEGEAVDVRVRLPLEMRRDVTQVGDLRIAVPGGRGGVPALVPLSELVKAERATSPSEISRRDLSREVLLTANLDDLPLGAAVEQIREAAARIEMAPGYEIYFPGETERMEESFGYMAEALLLAVVFVYLILAAQFESFIDPLSIMLSLPPSIVGMAGMLFLTGDTLSIMSLIGLILLMGLVTKNAILLVDYTKVLRKGGMERREALITAGRTRLRPILMTTLAMIFGMLPLALGLGQGAEMRAPLGRAVIGGLITSTVLTLLVVPVVYALFDDLALFIHRRWSKANALEQEAHGHTGKAAAKATAATLLLALLVPAPLASAAEPASSGRRVLTLSDALSIAAEKNRDVAKARAYQSWVRGKYVEERAGALPTVAATGSFGRSWDGTYAALTDGLFPSGQTVKTAGVSLTQTLFAWGKVGAAVRAAKDGIASAEDQLEHYRQAAARDVTEAFHDVLLAKRIEAIAKETLEQRERQLGEAERRHTLGTVTDYDVLAARVARDNQRPEVLRTASAVLVALDRLRLVLAEESGEIDVDGALEAEAVELPSFEEAVATALEKRPDLSGLVRNAAIYRQLVRIRNADDKPRLDLRANAGWQWFDAGVVSASGKVWGAGLYLSFPFFDGLATRGRVAQARSDLTRAELDLAQARDGIHVEVRTALDRARVAAEIVNALSGNVAQARRLLEMSETGRELGVKTRLEVDDALLNARAAEANLARAKRDYLVALADLRYAQGTL
ncbi:MAG TPA: efflux RND transporter permease subunit [Thermoanaerobaculia bacterium]|nr:efflux RND transporter permease subunit [Thermoanaerobaculia bacterium]HQN07123.1 efflux RND transporter permease subunit [Thermoanaerobaculia bacterium]